MMTGRDSNMFLNDVDTSLLCPICLGVLTDPQDTPCGHTFCKGCIQLHLQKAAVCPLDQSPISMKDLRRSPVIVRDFLGKLRTRCDHLKEGCDWEDKWSLLESHLDKCDFTNVRCVHPPCAAQMPRRNLQAHIDSCGYVNISCRYCKSLVIRNRVRFHYVSCKDFPLKCACKEVIKKKDMANHQNVCPEKEVACSVYAEYGCKHIAKRKDTDLHLKDTAHHHLDLLTSYIKSMKIKHNEEVEQLRNDIILLRKDFQSQQNTFMENIQKELISLREEKKTH